LSIAFWTMLSAKDSSRPAEIDYSTFYGLVEKDAVKQVTLDGRSIKGTISKAAKLDKDLTKKLSSTREFATTRPDEDKDLLPALRKHSVDINVHVEKQSWLGRLLISLLPWALLIGAWIWLSRRARGMMTGQSGPMGNFLKGRQKRFNAESNVEVGFDDVAGLGAAKRDLMEIVEFLEKPDRFRRLGGKVPRGVLLVGPPGTGKTLLARAVAGEAGVPFFSISASEFIELFVGVGARRVRDLFSDAKKNAPAIIFIDEIDAIGRSRGAGLGGGNDEREQTLNQLLSEMDGFDRHDQTIVMAATNRPDVLDPALLRPGRFDRRIIVDRPECQARRAILEVHSAARPLSEDVDLEQLAEITPGFSGAELENLVNEASLYALRRGASEIEQQDFIAAHDKLVLGDRRDSKLNVIEKERVAVHEAGHAVAAHFAPHAEPLHRVSIIPRGMSLGATQQSPGGDRHLMTQPELESRLTVLMGGYAAEGLVLGTPSTGAENDLKEATELAIKMVAHYGMSETLGAVHFDYQSEHPFLGQRLAMENGTSDATVHAIETEARRRLASALETARSILDDRRDALDRLITALLDRETIDREELFDILGESAATGADALPAPALHASHH